MIRLVTFYVPARYALVPIAFVWKNVVQRAVEMIPSRFRLPLAAVGTVAVILVGSMVEAETADNTRANRAISCFGLAVFIFLFWATSKNRKMIRWHTVIVGMLAQFVLAVFVLRTKAGVSPPPSNNDLMDNILKNRSMTSSTSSPTSLKPSSASPAKVPPS